MPHKIAAQAPPTERAAQAALFFLLRTLISFGPGHFDVQSFVVARNLLKLRYEIIHKLDEI
jgi:hypothetical protein